MTKQHAHIRSKIRWGIAGIFVLFIAAFAYDMPAVFNKGIDSVNNTVALGVPHIPDNEFRLGLDLQGGAHLVYQADVEQIPFVDRAQAVEGVRDVIERRVNAFGVGEPNVQTAKVGNDYRINVELAGITDVNQAITMIGETPILEFQEENNVPARELTPEEQQQIVEENILAQEKAEEIIATSINAENFNALVQEHTQDETSKNNDGYIGFLQKNLTGLESLYEWAEAHNDGDISTEVVESSLGYHILKRGAEQEGGTQVSASHILICYLGARDCSNPTFTKQEAQEKAQELFDQANATNFADLAKEFSTDPSAAVNQGDLGTFGKGAMVPEFEEAVFSAEVGQIVGPVESAFGFHVIYKTDESTQTEYELSHIFIQKTLETDILPPQDQWMPTGLSGKQLERAEVVTDGNTGAVQVSLQFDQEGTDLFEELTRTNIGKSIAIFLDGVPISIPTVNQTIGGGRAVITGTFTVKEAQLLSQRLNTGALPVPIELISQQTVGASLGAESLAKSMKAGMAGIVLVMVFMLFYYRLPGLISVISLTLYITMTLAVFKMIGVTLTLAGIAGFILSIGMAVDANVLIFERLKEELREGRSLKGAVEEGFLRAWTSIRDGNVSTLITCALLIWFGSSFVQGFAATLAIGILLSMFSAITITRVMLRFVVPWFDESGSSLFLGSQKE
jgi:protein-export membrane protein SecD